MSEVKAFMSWKLGQPTESAVAFPAPAEGHPLYETACPRCKNLLRTDRVRVMIDQHKLIRLDPDKAWRYKAGRQFNAPAVVIHNRCAKTAPTYKADRPLHVVVS